jgi:predicted nuclease of predicted toxin-antitoxin system
MRFLADAGISPKTIEFLRRLGHDAVHVRDLAMQRATDQQVIDLAQKAADAGVTRVQRFTPRYAVWQSAVPSAGRFLLVIQSSANA